MAIRVSKKIENLLKSLPQEFFDELFERDLPDGIWSFSGSDWDTYEAFVDGFNFAAKNGNNFLVAFYPEGVLSDGEVAFFLFRTEKVMKDFIDEILDDHPWGEE